MTAYDSTTPTDEKRDEQTNEGGLPFDAWGDEKESDGRDFGSPDGVQAFIQECVREDLAPTVDDLVAAPIHEDIDGGGAVAEYLMRATETGMNATDALARIDEYDLEDRQALALKWARELLWSTAAWVETGKDGHLDDMVHDLEQVSDAVQAAVDEPLDVPTPQAEGGHPEDSKWEKHTECPWANVTSPLVNFEVGRGHEDDDVSGWIKLLEYTTDEKIPLATHVEGPVQGVDVELGATHHLSIAQAERLAEALGEYAADAREEREADE